MTATNQADRATAPGIIPAAPGLEIGDEEVGDPRVGGDAISFSRGHHADRS
jgi:hypothetical protein